MKGERLHLKSRVANGGPLFFYHGFHYIPQWSIEVPVDDALYENASLLKENGSVTIRDYGLL
jgi:hypothetical protein